LLGKQYADRGDFDSAMRWLQQGLEQVQASWGRAIFARQLGLISLDLGNLDDAEAYFDLAVQLAPWNPDGYWGAALTLTARGDLDRAIVSLELGLSKSGLQPDQRAAWYVELGQLYERAGRGAMALQTYRSALELDPENEPASQATKRLESQE
jgi:tetratricopeptide (TPR) repeat protein